MQRSIVEGQNQPKGPIYSYLNSLTQETSKKTKQKYINSIQQISNDQNINF